MKPLDLRQIPEEFRTFATALLRQADPEAALIRLLGTIGPLVSPDSAAAFARLLKNTLTESERMRRTTDYFLGQRIPPAARRASHRRGCDAEGSMVSSAVIRPHGHHIAEPAIATHERIADESDNGLSVETS